MRKTLFCLLAAIALSACSGDIIYSHFHPMMPNEWHADSVVNFDYTIEDADASYSMILYVRHTERYPYQNMWLFIDNSARRDTIEFYLSDDRGQWLGDRHHGFIEMPVLLEQNYQFPDTGIYHMTIQHGMRDSVLLGITDIGLEIIRNGQK